MNVMNRSTILRGIGAVMHDDQTTTVDFTSASNDFSGSSVIRTDGRITMARPMRTDEALWL